MYPDVYMEFRRHRQKFGDASLLSTPDVLTPPGIGQEVHLQMGMNKLAKAKLLAILPPEDESSKRGVLFRLDGEVCLVQVQDDQGR
jgi:pyruvate carboxylase